MENETIVADCGDGQERAYRPGVDGLIEAMGRDGDSKNTWDPNNPAEVAAAEATYDTLIKKGYKAYSVDPEKGEKGEQIDAFNPKSGRLIMVPPIVGG